MSISTVGLRAGVYALACLCGDYLTIEEPGSRNPYMLHTILRPAEFRKLMACGQLTPLPPDRHPLRSRRHPPSASGHRHQLELL